MTRNRRPYVLIIGFAVASLVIGRGAGAEPSDDTRLRRPTLATTDHQPKCRNIDADFTSELTTEGCTSPVGVCATGTITHSRLIAGSMFATINDLAPSAGMPASEPPSMLSISGERSLTPDRGGALSAHITGIFDTAQGYFDELDVITGGTGPLAGATGAIHLFGRATGPTTFAGGIRGRICVP